MRQSGNVIFALFGAVALVGVIGASANTVLRGPVTTMQTVTQKTVAENQMLAAGRLALIAAIQQADGGDCDGDSTIEPVPYSTAGHGSPPPGGGYLPSTIGASQSDPWGTQYGYCVWDHGAIIDSLSCGEGRLAGVDDENGIVIAIISAGPDRSFQTSCGDHPDYVTKQAGTDDIVLSYTYGEAAGIAGGLWNLKSGDPDTAEIGKDIEVRSSAGNVVFGVDTRTDADRPAIRTDFVNKLSESARGITFLSDLLADSRVITGRSGTKGTYNSSQVQGIWSMGHNYDIDTGPNNFGSQYGLAYAHTNAGTGVADKKPIAGWGHQILYTNNGTPTAAVSLSSGHGYFAGNVGIGTDAPTHKLNVSGQLRLDHNSSYDVWIQGGTATSGAERNLALLGRKSDDRLYLNHGSEYTGGTHIGGPVFITAGQLSMNNNKIAGLGAPTAAADAATKQYVDTRVTEEISASPGVPAGAVMAFDLNSCPPGWTSMSTAQGRFIVGTGEGYSRGNTGGANTVALTVAQLPAHNHSGTTSSAGAHTHGGTTGSSGSHSHSTSHSVLHAQGGNGYGYRVDGAGQNAGSWRLTNVPTNSTGAHTHSFTTNSAGAHTHTFTTNNTGSGQAHENRPPYLALLYCRKN